MFVLVGKYGTRVVLTGVSKLQSVVALSTAEAEITAILMAAKRLLALLPLYEELFGPLKVLIHSDASAAIGAVKKGLSKTMGYLKRKSHAISLAWLKEVFSREELCLLKEATADNVADIMTKAFPGPRFAELMRLLGMQPRAAN